jgi:hypothetical protein
VVLPLLSHALDQAWRSKAGRDLTLADYARTGGIEAAVAASAERAYGQLTAGQQEAARQVFTRLVATTRDDIDAATSASRAGEGLMTRPIITGLMRGPMRGPVRT